MTKLERRPKSEIRNPNDQIRHSLFVVSLGVGFRLAQSGDAVPFLPLAAFLEDFEALEALEDIAFSAQGGGGAEAAML
jgi:hypothetical protein